MIISPAMIIQSLEANHRILKMQAEGVTHMESVKAPHDPVNTFNWVLGHIIQHRDLMLKLLNAEPFLTEDEAALYTYGSKPITEGSECVPFERLLELLEQSQTRLVEKLKTMSDDDLSDFDVDRPEHTIGHRLNMLAWHETYHTGQTEYTRQIAGKDDRLI